MRTPIALLVAAIGLSACGSIFVTAEDAQSIAERHPITVDQQTVTLTFAATGRDGLSRLQLAQLDEFVTSYRTKGYGPITVTAPSGTAADLEARGTAASVREALNAMGVAYEDIRGASYRSTARSGDILVSFTNYVAIGPNCGQFGDDVLNRFRNQRSENFGCFAQHNLAAMIADPRDLVTPQAGELGRAEDADYAIGRITADRAAQGAGN